MKNPVPHQDPKQMTSKQGDAVMWFCIGVALFVTIALPLLVG